MRMHILLYIYGDDDGGGGGARLPPKYPPRHKTITLRLASGAPPSTHRSSRGRPATSALARALLNKAKAHSLSVCVRDDRNPSALFRCYTQLLRSLMLRECAVLTKYLTTCHNHTTHRKTLDGKQAIGRERHTKRFIFQQKDIKILKDFKPVTFVNDKRLIAQIQKLIFWFAKLLFKV